MDAQVALDPFTFANKASTLARLEGRLAAARVLPQITISAQQWTFHAEIALNQVLSAPWAVRRAGEDGWPLLIVRSSAGGEDSDLHSLAGHFASVQNVAGRAALRDAIARVFASYGESAARDPEVLIQPMLQGVLASGVATSREVGSGRPYFVINTSYGEDTTLVTAGRSNGAEVYYHFRGALEAPPGQTGAIVRLMRELEAVTGLTRLDIEFAFVRDENLPVLLQARPLVGTPPLSAPRDRHCRRLAQAESKVRKLLQPHPLARGRRGALGVMPDWNPAEMIGVRPKPLALSLYRSLVTDQVWAGQRRAYGYRDLAGFPLLVEVLGTPYIDVRASFESFVPAAMDLDAVDPLVEHYMDRLFACPHLHDKVEFEVVVSCCAFDIDDRLARLRQGGVPPDVTASLHTALHGLTRRLIDPTKSPRFADLAALDTLQSRREALRTAGLDPLAEAYWLLEDCRRYGTAPFAGLARMGFIAVEMLNSLVAVGAIDEEDRRAFLMGVSTVTTQMQRDLTRLPRAAFLERYGHLRPGAYDILSPRYDEAPTLYFGEAKEPVAPQAERANGWTHDLDESRSAQGWRDVRARLVSRAAPLLARCGFDIAPEAFVDGLADGVRDRERAKFLFTRNLSDALARLKAWGEEAGLSAGELAYADIRAIRDIYGSARDPVDLFCESIREGRDAHAITAATCLPPLITDAKAVWGFALPLSTPNFVTSQSAQGRVVSDLDRARLPGAIVLIPSADPGFDWIFACKPAGLITAYGGANSHMAIRAAELDLPAVIGAGERLFAEWSQAPSLKIDCANRRVDRLPM
jgi:phosphohistidine swiveling domain-containing protein